MEAIEKLTEIEKALRRPANDKVYLLEQLKALTNVLAGELQDGTGESGLAKGCLGGLHYVLKRLREHYGVLTKSFEELETIYANVELSRFDDSVEGMLDSQDAFRKDAILFHRHLLELSDGSKVWAFSSAKDQVTVDGLPIAEGELLDGSKAQVMSFTRYITKLRRGALYG